MGQARRISRRNHRNYEKIKGGSDEVHLGERGYKGGSYSVDDASDTGHCCRGEGGGGGKEEEEEEGEVQFFYFFGRKGDRELRSHVHTSRSGGG